MAGRPQENGCPPWLTPVRQVRPRRSPCSRGPLRSGGWPGWRYWRSWPGWQPALGWQLAPGGLHPAGLRDRGRRGRGPGGRGRRSPSWPLRRPRRPLPRWLRPPAAVGTRPWPASRHPPLSSSSASWPPGSVSHARAASLPRDQPAPRPACPGTSLPGTSLPRGPACPGTSPARPESGRRPGRAARHGTAARPLRMTTGIRWIAACPQERTPGQACPEGRRLWR